MINNQVSANFDQYGRYFLIAKIIESNRSKEVLNILDVGGLAGLARLFMPLDNITIIDVIKSDIDNYIQASALDMPFQDKQFDVVITADTFEHISKKDRNIFLDECYRVSKDFFILAAPFETGEISKTEAEVNNIYNILSGESYVWLKEHMDNGLPQISSITSWIQKNRLFYLTYPNNFLIEWKYLISLYFFLENLPSKDGTKLFNNISKKYNETTNQIPSKLPSYRHVFAISSKELVKPLFNENNKLFKFNYSEDIAKIIKAYLNENSSSISDYVYYKTSIKHKFYKAQYDIKINQLNEELLKTKTNFNNFINSNEYKIFKKLQSKKTFNIYYKFFYICSNMSTIIYKIFRYKTYLLPDNLYWRLKTKTPAYLKNSLNDILFKQANNPDVSIIIPVYGKVILTVNCLLALSKIKTKYKYEVIVVNDNSPDSTLLVLNKINNLITVSNTSNLGFVDSCNNGALKAKGKYIVFLNNDTNVDVNWLDPLIEELELNNKAGIVGSKLIRPNGLLQEAGSIVYTDGTAGNYGSYDDPNKYQYNYKREVDYCSGASLAIRRSVFMKAGMFDTKFRPGYYEDTDLCLTLRNMGYSIIYQPLSRLVHIEGGTSGNNLSSGMKKYQTINRKIFLNKWSEYLNKNNYSSEEFNIKARDKSGDKLALVIDHYCPEPDKDSGSVRMFRLLNVLKNMGYKVTFWPDNYNTSRDYIELLEVNGIEVVNTNIVNFISFSESFAENYDLVIVSRYSVAPSYINYLRDYYINSKIIYDTVDLAFYRYDRQFKLSNNSEISQLSNDIRLIELGTMQRTDATLVVSNKEKELLNSINPEIKVGVVSNIHELKLDKAKSFNERQDLLFIGGFNHDPNVDAIIWFCNSIMPIINKKLPNLRITIIGSNPTSEILKLSNRNIKVVGYVKDVSEYFNRARVFVAPLRYGAGVKGKIGQAIEFGLPIVSTSIGVEGMFLKDNNSCMVADNETEFANKVIKLYQNEKLWLVLRDNSRKVLLKHFSAKNAEDSLKRLIKIL